MTAQPAPLAALGAWRAADDPNENIFGDGVGCDILDAAGFPICEIPSDPVLHDWAGRFPAMRHWADGADDGRTQIERTPEQLAAIVRLITAAPDLLRVAELLVYWLDEEPGAHKLCDTARAAIAKATGRTA